MTQNIFRQLLRTNKLTPLHEGHYQLNVPLSFVGSFEVQGQHTPLGVNYKEFSA